MLGSNCIACLAHLAILCEEVAGRTGLPQLETYNLCDSTLQRLGTLTSELHFDEYTHLDLLLGVRLSSCCFLIAMTQMGDLHRILGGSLYQSLMFA